MSTISDKKRQNEDKNENKNKVENSGETNSTAHSLKSLDEISSLKLGKIKNNVQVPDFLANEVADKKGPELKQQFVKDHFYEKGYRKLKIRQASIAILLWLVLLVPLFIMLNSIGPRAIFPFIYRWQFQGARAYAHIVELLILTTIILIVISTFLLLLRNNFRERFIYPYNKTYDGEGQKIRQKVLEDIYAERYGMKGFRENIRYYSVEPWQNLPNELVENAIKAAQEAEKLSHEKPKKSLSDRITEAIEKNNNK